MPVSRHLLRIRLLLYLVIVEVIVVAVVIAAAATAASKEYLSQKISLEWFLKLILKDWYEEEEGGPQIELSATVNKTRDGPGEAWHSSEWEIIPRWC